MTRHIVRRPLPFALTLLTSLVVLSIPSVRAQSQGDAAPAADQAAQAAPSDRWFFPFAIFVANANVNSSTLLPGSVVFFAAPNVPLSRSQFNISAGNTFLGVDFKFPKIGDAEVNAKIDFDFRGTSPIENQNVFQPMFGDIYIELKNPHYRLVAGQTTDVVSPLLPTNLNFFPFSYIPGSIGFIRPMVRGEAYLPVRDDAQVTVQAALAQAIQTFQVSNEAIARQAGWPDVQGRVAFGYGPPNPLLGRPMEFGASAHLGQRKLTLSDGTNIYHNTYSINFDGRAAIGPRIKLQGEFFTGQLLGDYMGGVFQTFDVNTGNAVGAKGGWIEGGYKLPEDWTFHIGYGVDNVDESSVSSVVSRTQNGIFYANAFFDWSPELALSGEVSWWKTKYFDQSINNTVFRLELALIYKWIGH